MNFRLIRSLKLIFWDFDGVIKDSVSVKTDAFVKLFLPYGAEVAKKVQRHHEENGGMSRFEKFPIYMRWVGEEPTEGRVKAFCEKFSRIVLKNVIDSPWVPGAEKYLRLNPNNQIFVLVSATPQDEIEHIVETLDLRRSFVAVFGAPTSKKEAIRITLGNYKIPSLDCLMIGDATADMEAARSNNVPFLLRLHATNRHILEKHNVNFVEDFTAL
jgi:phosphoglycolate phosphatase-like HAD superfamily hydrolase